jgi:hypothetical protein
MHFSFGDTCYRVYRKQEVSITEPEKAARTNFEHSHLPLVLVNEKRTYVTDVFTMCIDHFAIADVPGRIFKLQARIRQFFKFSIRTLWVLHAVVLSCTGGAELRRAGRSGWLCYSNDVDEQEAALSPDARARVHGFEGDGVKDHDLEDPARPRTGLEVAYGDPGIVTADRALSSGPYRVGLSELGVDVQQ